MKTQLFINQIVRETEKALLISTNVYFNANAEKPRDIWMPKSVVEMIEGRTDLIAVEDWFLSKCSKQNAFKGYEMRFAGIISNYINA